MASTPSARSIALASVTSCGGPQIRQVASVDGSASFSSVASIRPRRPDFVFLTGWDCVLVPMLLAGCDGGTHASSNAVPEVTKKVYELCKAGKWDASMPWQHRLVELFDAMMQGFEFPDGFRAGAETRGFKFGSPRVPQTAKQQEDRARLAGMIRCLISDFELIDKPDFTCPVRAPMSLARPAEPQSGNLDAQAIAARVMSELSRKGVI